MAKLGEINFGQDIPLVANTDLSAKQFFFVKIATADNNVILCANAGDESIGVLQNKPKAGEAAAVRPLGVSKVVAGAAITRGARIASDALGKAKAASALVQATGAASNVLGIALESVAADLEVISAFICVGSGIQPTSEA